ncbi:MAG: acyl-CoA dehydrogenase family protein [Thermincola sp.]|jgi:alkylation response protein AidB-like acyl-CoA dehydrogenase|nr:acyl-CoA dehydrogenase family protein [Thermincola sp.]MDT3704975.1 acyl-CoA dehydrogenase family protein [Thermincola sp.]
MHSEIFALSEEQQMIINLAKNFAEKEIKPLAEKIEEDAIFPREIFNKMAELGLTGITTDEKYDGAGQSYLTYACVMEQIAHKCMNVSGLYSVHVTVQNMVQSYGNEDQKERYLRKLACGEIIGALCLTEANAGSDAAALSTTAKKQGNDYVIDGTKIFVTSGGEAELYLVYAKTNPAAGAKGISAFIVEKGNPGMIFGKKEKKMGYNGSPTREIVFDNCRVPQENLLGEEGAGFKIIMKGLEGGRISIGAIALGIAQASLDYAVDYMKVRKQFGQPLSDFQGLQFMIADMATAIEASRLLVYEAATAKDKGLPVTQIASMAKLHATDTAMKVSTDAVQLLGGYGYMKDYPVERYMRHAKVTQIFEGTNQIQRMLIARKIFE